jgi:hypothetical protein
MSQQANVTQIDALKHFRSVLVEYQARLRDACDMLTHEGNRGVDWIDTDRAAYWPARVRRLEEELVAAKNALEQCMLRGFDDVRPSCIDEKKRVAQLKTKLDHARTKVKETRAWKSRILRDGDEFQTRIVQVNDYADAELPKAIVALDRMIDALEKYASRTEAPPRAAPAESAQAAKPEGAEDSA